MRVDAGKPERDEARARLEAETIRSVLARDQDSGGPVTDL
jgi:hypothetical protein